MKGKRRGNQFNIIAFFATREIFFMLILTSGLKGGQLQNLHEALDVKFGIEPLILKSDEINSCVFGVSLIYLRVTYEDCLFRLALKM